MNSLIVPNPENEIPMNSIQRNSFTDKRKRTMENPVKKKNPERLRSLAKYKMNEFFIKSQNRFSVSFVLELMLKLHCGFTIVLE